MSIKPAKQNISIFNPKARVTARKTTEQLIEEYKQSRRTACKCKACGEPREEDAKFGYCSDCYREIVKRANVLKKLIENDPAIIYNSDYVVTDITKLY